MYRIVHGLVDIPAAEHLQQASLRTRGHHLRFVVPFAHTTVYYSSFFPQAVRLWNSLSSDVVSANNLASFRLQLSKTNFFSVVSS